MSYSIRDPQEDILIPDARESVHAWYTLTELRGAKNLGITDEINGHESFQLLDGRVVVLYSIDLNYCQDNLNLLIA